MSESNLQADQFRSHMVIMLSLELSAPLSIPTRELSVPDNVFYPGHLSCPGTQMRSSPHSEAPEGRKEEGDMPVPPKRGIKWPRNADKERWKSRLY